MTKKTEEFKKLSIKELQERLQELETNKQKLEADMFRHNGSSVRVRNYPSQKQQRPYGNLRNIKKDIARVKTFLNIKMFKVID